MGSNSKAEAALLSVAAWFADGISQFVDAVGGNGTLIRAQYHAQRAAYDRGQTSISNLFVGIMIASIIGLSVAIPVINDAISNGNLTGTSATIANLLPLFVVLLLLMALAGPVMNRA